MDKNFKLKKGDIVVHENEKGNYAECIDSNLDGLNVGKFERIYGKIFKIMRPEYKTFYGDEEILDDIEKKYLYGVIRPFRSRVKNIKKFYNKGKEFICIYLKNNENFDFPYFERGKMYKGMQIGKEYTLEELGL